MAGAPPGSWPSGQSPRVDGRRYWRRADPCTGRCGAVPAPAFLPTRRHPWAVGDRCAWGEETVTVPAAFRATLDRLLAMRRPVPADNQLIHGDLSGNVLFPDHGDPVIIDFSPYWRPAAFGDAIVIADALMYFDAGTEVIDLGLGSAETREPSQERVLDPGL